MQHIYLIDGRTIMSKSAEDGDTVDGCHPNDLGFYAMAQRIAELWKREKIYGN